MNRDLKNALAYYFTMLFILLMASCFLISCKAKVPVIENQKTEIRIKDSVIISHKEVISKGITDSIKFFIGDIKTSRPDCDSITLKAITQMLMRLQTKKQSGDNGYEIKYNEALQQLELIIKTAASKQIENNMFSEKSNDKAIKIEKPILVNVPKTKFEIFLLISGIVGILIIIIRFLLFVKSKLPI